MNPSDKLTVQMTTRLFSLREPEFSEPARIMTARAALDEYRDLRRGGTAVGVRMMDANKNPVRISDLEFAAEDWS